MDSGKGYSQHIMPEGEKLSLAEFTGRAIIYLEENEYDNEVVKLANDIIELERDTLVKPDNIVSLPEGFSYRFSGFWGQVIGIVRNYDYSWFRTKK